MNSILSCLSVFLIIVLSFVALSSRLANGQSGQTYQSETPKPREILPPAEKKKSIGRLILSKGVVSSRSADQSTFLLSKGSEVFLMDTITTANKSFAVIQFNDGSKTTIRPNTELVLSEFDQTSGNERKTIELIKGGLRSITGAIGKVRPKNVQYRVRNLTIGIRGTEFVLVLCQNGICETSGEEAAQQLLGDSELKPLGDIFVNNKSTGEKQRLDRQDFRESLSGLYVSVQDGAIRLESDDWFIDMPAGESCLAGGSGAIECFKQGIGLEDVDQYLNGNIEQLFILDLRDNNQNPGSQEFICEVL